VTEMVMGSVSEQVMRASHRPVLVIGPALRPSTQTVRLDRRRARPLAGRESDPADRRLVDAARPRGVAFRVARCARSPGLVLRPTEPRMS